MLHAVIEAYSRIRKILMENVAFGRISRQIPSGISFQRRRDTLAVSDP